MILIVIHFIEEGENDDEDDIDGKTETIKKLHQILYTER